MKKATAETQQPIQMNLSPINRWKAMVGELRVNLPILYSVMISGIDQVNRKQAQAMRNVRLPETESTILLVFSFVNPDNVVTLIVGYKPINRPVSELVTAIIRGKRQTFPVPMTHPIKERINPAV